MRLVVCDADRILCEALAATLGACGHKVLALAATADDCVEAVASCRPDVCELDLHLPDPEDGLQAVREIGGRCPATAVLVMSELKDPGIWKQVRGLGVAGLVGKDRSISQIADALRMIDGGNPVFDPARRRSYRPAPRCLSWSPPGKPRCCGGSWSASTRGRWLAR